MNFYLKIGGNFGFSRCYTAEQSGHSKRLLAKLAFSLCRSRSPPFGHEQQLYTYIYRSKVTGPRCAEISHRASRPARPVRRGRPDGPPAGRAPPPPPPPPPPRRPAEYGTREAGGRRREAGGGRRAAGGGTAAARRCMVALAVRRTRPASSIVNQVKLCASLSLVFARTISTPTVGRGGRHGCKGRHRATGCGVSPASPPEKRARKERESGPRRHEPSRSYVFAPCPVDLPSDRQSCTPLPPKMLQKTPIAWFDVKIPLYRGGDTVSGGSFGAPPTRSAGL